TGLRVAVRIDVLPLDRHIPVVAIGVRGPNRGRRLGCFTDLRADVEALLGHRFYGRCLPDQAGDLLGVQRRAVDLEILDRALQQWVRVESAADEAGRSGGVCERDAGLDDRED